MEFKDIENIVIYSIEEFYKNDRVLIEIASHEASITARIAMYMRDIIEAGNESNNGENKVNNKSNDKEKIVVDCEYNRHLRGQKYINGKNGKKMRPDIIIHTRGCDDNNLLFCEAKIKDLNCADKNKINNAVNTYNYKWALGVCNIQIDKITLKWYTKSKWPQPVACHYTINNNKLILQKKRNNIT